MRAVAAETGIKLSVGIEASHGEKSIETRCRRVAHNDDMPVVLLGDAESERDRVRSAEIESDQAVAVEGRSRAPFVVSRAATMR